MIITTEKIIKKISDKLDVPQIEVALELNTLVRKNGSSNSSQNLRPFQVNRCKKRKLAVMLIEKHKEEHIPLVENNIAVLDENSKKALVNEILDAKATNYYRLVDHW